MVTEKVCCKYNLRLGCVLRFFVFFVCRTAKECTPADTVAEDLSSRRITTNLRWAKASLMRNSRHRPSHPSTQLVTARVTSVAAGQYLQ